VGGRVRREHQPPVPRARRVARLLVFADDSLEAIANRALDRETGARGLRSILEETLLDVQFELPSRRDVKKYVVTKETIEKGLKPTLVTEAAPDEDTGEQHAESA
jgi:ATP-dependent Clp protease ATP-binding subunit ClpX